MRLAIFLVALAGSIVGSISASPVGQQPFAALPRPHVTATSHPRPLVIWHGLGDTALSEGISSWIDHIKELYPGIYVHSVQIPEDGSADDERKAGFYGNAIEQAEAGAAQISGIQELQGGFDAVGFSQGGLFLRSYAQFAPPASPRIHHLVTFGTPHYGIAALIPCPTPPSLTCLLAARAARAGIYRPWAQRNLVQAAYFRDPERLDEYFGVNVFLRDLCGEGRVAEDRHGLGLGEMSATAPRFADESQDAKGTNGDDENDEARWRMYGGNGLAGLDALVAVQFDADRTVSPAQSAHFATYKEGNKTEVVPLQAHRMWKEDWIGLRELYERGEAARLGSEAEETSEPATRSRRGGLVFEHCPGEHMDLNTGDCGERMIREWIGWPVEDEASAGL